MKYVGAFLLGALCLWLAQQIWAPAPVPAAQRAASPPAVQSVAAGLPQQQLAPAEPKRATAGQRADSASATTNDKAQPQATREATPPNDATQIQQAVAPDDAPRDIPAVELQNDIPPLPTPIPVPMSDAHRDVAERTETIAELHNALESEPEDVAWAYEMQTNIQQFLLQSEPMQSFGSASVHCRTALCEIQAIGYAPGASTGQTQWSVVMGQMRLQAWYSNFSKSHGYSSSDGEQTVIFTFLERNPRTLEQAG